ncbi:hypothetical protein ES708_27209 [subsurface metagenome]
MKLSDLNPFNKLKKREVKMSDNELTLEALQESLVKEVEARQALETRVENLVQSSSGSSGDNQPGEVKQLRDKVTELEQEKPLLKHQGIEEFAEAVKTNQLGGIRDSQFLLIRDALQAQGYDIVLKEQLAEATGEAETEEAPEPPYLHIIDEERLGKLSDEERKGYSPWTGGKFARLVEAV